MSSFAKPNDTYERQNKKKKIKKIAESIIVIERYWNWKHAFFFVARVGSVCLVRINNRKGTDYQIGVFFYQPLFSHWGLQQRRSCNHYNALAIRPYYRTEYWNSDNPKHCAYISMVCIWNSKRITLTTHIEHIQSAHTSSAHPNENQIVLIAVFCCRTSSYPTSHS